VYIYTFTASFYIHIYAASLPISYPAYLHTPSYRILPLSISRYPILPLSIRIAPAFFYCAVQVIHVAYCDIAGFDLLRGVPRVGVCMTVSPLTRPEWLAEA
jgi:hypothetical protein